MSSSYVAADGPMACSHEGLNLSPYLEARAEIARLEAIIAELVSELKDQHVTD